jgi:3-hydroxy-9,10-secoandrosta-1,3,5(10)-triene-9,17-dione monooxygenase
MQEASAAPSTFAVHEPDLTQREIVARAAAMRPALLERQQETEDHTFYAQDTHRAFSEAGFYRILQPRRFGGYGFDLETYFRVIIEIARGCPSTGWCLCLGGAHVLQVASMFDEQAQAEFFGPDGHFVCASYGAPVGVAQPRDDGYVIGGKFSYASGIPYSTHFMGQTLLPRGPADPGLMFVVSAEQFERLDDWHGVLGMRGSGSHSIQIDDAWVPASHTARVFMVDLPVEGGTVGSRLHGNPMYAGRTLGFFHGEFGAIMVGSAYAALDEYQRIITRAPATWIPTMKRYELVDYQRYLGEAIAEIATAEAAVIQGAQQWMELARQNVEEDRPFTAEDDSAPGGPAGHRLPDRLARRRGHPLPHRRLGGRDGQRMQRYWRDMSTYWSHNTPAQRDFRSRASGAGASGCRSPPGRTRRRASPAGR